MPGNPLWYRATRLEWGGEEAGRLPEWSRELVRIAVLCTGPMS